MAVRMPKKRGPKRHSAENGHSRFEAQILAEVKHGGVTPLPPRRIPYVCSHHYIPDVVLPNGIVIEVKGWFPQQDRSKMLAVKRSNPGLDIRFVFLNGHRKISKQSDTQYGWWASKNGFKWAEKHIPLEWLFEKTGRSVNNSEEN